MLMTKQQIASAKDFSTKEVDMVAEWGGKILIRSMTVGQNLEITKELDAVEFSFKLIMACCINEDGSLLFDDPVNDIAILKARDTKHISKLVKAIEAVNNLAADQQDELAKN